jgi:hypothetical protein
MRAVCVKKDDTRSVQLWRVVPRIDKLQMPHPCVCWAACLSIFAREFYFHQCSIFTDSQNQDTRQKSSLSLSLSLAWSAGIYQTAHGRKQCDRKPRPVYYGTWLGAPIERWVSLWSYQYGAILLLENLRVSKPVVQVPQKAREPK